MESQPRSATGGERRIPFINSASYVTILTIDSGRNPERFGAEPGANLLEHLSRYGARVEIANITSEGVSVADVILDQAAERDANLLVIGASSHPSTTEIPFGEIGRATCRERVCT